MRIAGLQNLSLIDYPGHLAAAVFVQGCNFRCGYCHNPDLIDIKNGTSFPEEEILECISSRSDMLEGIVITGGEPCIYEDLPEFARKAKEKGFRVKLDTNGSNPAQLEHMIREKLLDYIALDVKTSLEKYPLLTDMADIAEAISKSVRIVILSTLPYEIRTTCVPGIVDGEDIRALKDLIKGAKKCCLQQFRPLRTYDEKFKDIQPYSGEELQEFCDILKEFVQEVEIRGI
jgi:pyruvate formate lyase activating enzyme